MKNQPRGDESKFPRLRQKLGNFHLFSLKCRISVYIYQKSTRQWKGLKTLKGSSPNFALSYHATFSQPQTGATVALKFSPCQV
jgi:hypothetical protein